MLKGQTQRNIVLAIFNFGLSTIVSFFLTGYITNTIGSEAYGFNTMANDITSYLFVLTSSLNYLSNRFISIYYNKGNKEEANGYFNTVFWTNFAICLACGGVCIPVILKLEQIITIPESINFDVKLTFALVFAQAAISLLDTAFLSGTYVTNRMDLNSSKLMRQTIIKVVSLIVLFTVFSPHIFYVPLANILGMIFSLVLDIGYVQKLTPGLSVNMKYIKISKLKELVTSGIWNSITQLGIIIESGLDLIITNQFIGNYEMGLLAVAKTVPAAFSTLGNAIFNAMAPKQTILYANGNKNDLKKEILCTRKLICFIVMPIISVYMLMAKSFLKLWLPSKSSQEIQIMYILTCLICLRYPAFCVYKGLTNVPIMYNKQKITAIQNVCTNLLGLFTTLILLMVTNKGVYIIAGISPIFVILGDCFIYVPYVIYLLKESQTEMFIPILADIFKMYFIYVVCILMADFFAVDSWIFFIIYVAILSIVLYSVIFMLTFNKEEKKYILSKVMRRI